jgi:hypothetical protein
MRMVQNFSVYMENSKEQGIERGGETLRKRGGMGLPLSSIYIGEGRADLAEGQSPGFHPQQLRYEGEGQPTLPCPQLFLENCGSFIA